MSSGAGSTTRTVFLGPPGAGKGTQAKGLAERCKTLHISSGDMLREHLERGTEAGQKAKAFMDSGRLVPDDLIIAMVLERISRADASGSWIVDGFPRTLEQARSLDQCLGLTTGGPQGLTHAVYFAVPHSILVVRLTGRRSCSQCGAIWHVEFMPTRKPGRCDTCGGALKQRADDKAEVVEKRLQEYRELTQPLLGYYRARGVLVEVDANRPRDVVLDDLLVKLHGRGKVQAG